MRSAELPIKLTQAGAMQEIDEYLEGESQGFARLAEPVLLVDDSAVMRTVIRRLLHAIGIKEIIEAPDAKTAYAELQKNQVNTVICDIEMEPISGLQLLSAIRANPGCSSVPFIFVTASRNQRHVSAAKHARAEAYLLKPFSADGLRKAIKDALLNRKPPQDEHGPVQKSAREGVQRWVQR